MKKILRKGLSILLMACMVLTLMPAFTPSAQAAGPVARGTTLDLTATQVHYRNTSNDTIGIDPATQNVTDCAEGWSWYPNGDPIAGYSQNTLVLDGMHLETGNRRGIHLPPDSTIVLAAGSTNSVFVNNGTNGSLGYGVEVYEDPMFTSPGYLTVKGSGVLSITVYADNAMGIKASNGHFNLESGTVYAQVNGTTNATTVSADPLGPNIVAYQKSEVGTYDVATTWNTGYLTFMYNGNNKTTDIKIVNGTVSTSSAAVSNHVLEGQIGTPLSNMNAVTVTLTDCAFTNLAVGDIVTDWFTNLPAGISVSVSAVDEGTATLAFSGTPAATSNASMSITIPGARLSTEEELTVTANSDARFSITPIPPTRTDALNLTATYINYYNTNGQLTGTDPTEMNVITSEGWSWYPYGDIAAGYGERTLVLNGLNLQVNNDFALKLPSHSNILLVDGSSNQISAVNSAGETKSILALGNLEITGNLQNTGSLLVTSGATSSALSACVYVRAADNTAIENLTISGGTIILEAGDALNSSYGVYANDVVTLSGGTIYAKSGTVVAGTSAPVIASSINSTGMWVFQKENGEYTKPTNISGYYSYYYTTDNGTNRANDIRVSPVSASFPGIGTLDNPYQISTAAELKEMSDLVYSYGAQFAGKHYELTADIVLNEDLENNPEQWKPIGGYSHFTGVFDGNNHTISGLYINDDELNYAGLFAYVREMDGQGGIVRNVGLVNSSITAADNAGGIVGRAQNATIENCYFMGSVEGDRAGGIVGNNESSTIDRCYNTGSVDGVYAGGIVGQNYDGHIQNSYNTGAISAFGSVQCMAGGIAGLNAFAQETIVNCYNTGSVSVQGSAYGCTIYAGGITGWNRSSSIRNCYSTGALSATGPAGQDFGMYTGGIAGRSELDENGIIEDAYWLGSTAELGIGLQPSMGSARSPEGGQASDGCMALSANDMKASYFVTGLNTAVNELSDTYPNLSSWRAAEPEENGGYPVFGTASTYILTISGGGNGSTVGGIYAAGAAVPISAGTKDGYTFTGWTTTGSGTFANTSAANTTFTMPAGPTTITANWSQNNLPSTPSNPSTPANNDSTQVIVNGQPVSAGKARTTTDADGKKVTTVTIDSGRLETILSAQSAGATVTIPVTDNSDRAVGTLTGQMVKSMESKEAVLIVQMPDSSYTLPASQINIDAVSKQLGSSVSLADIAVSVSVSAPTDEMAQVVENAQENGGLTLVAPAVDFTITCTYGGQSVQVSLFNSYVERTIAIPQGVDPSKITTGVFVGPDGSVHHVPTRITVINGRYYAVINSLTNSAYSVVWNPVEFLDTADSWAKESIHDMGSRMVINGVGKGNFDPNRAITRAEFAAVIVRALGLKAGSGTGGFTDVALSDWYAGYVQTATSYGIITGYPGNTFGPNDTITREQAMTMVARAMAITGLDANVTSGDAGVLIGAYADATAISNYAAEGVAACLKTAVVSGRGGKMLAPLEKVTRAETAVMIERLLSHSDLI